MAVHALVHAAFAHLGDEAGDVVLGDQIVEVMVGLENDAAAAAAIAAARATLGDKGFPMESDAPFAARGINSAADYVEDAAEKIRNGTFRDIVDGASDFAKRQPAAFLGLSVLAGFAAVRFLKTSGGQTSSSQGEDGS